MEIIIVILLIIIAYYLYRIYSQKRVQIAQRNYDEAKIRPEEAVKHASQALYEATERNKKQFADAAAKLTRENPDLRMTLNKDMIKRLLELEKISDFRIPESIARQIKEHNLN